jgi:FkbM family methyltransferase
MYKFEFINPCDKYPFGCLSIESGNFDQSLSTPITMHIVSNVDGVEKWKSDPLTFNMWTKYFEPTNCSMLLKDANGDILKLWNWDTFLHGDDIHKEFLIWSIKNMNSKGIAIGTNDGTTGEWVTPVRSGLINAVLVEASQDPFLKLSKNYKDFRNVKLQCDLINTKSEECIFYESENSFTNSVYREHVEGYGKNIIEVTKFSKSLNDLIIENGLEKDLKWLHIDVEGIDDYLIMSLDESKVNLPEVIIYESLNLSESRKSEIIDWLNKRNYRCIDNEWNSMAIRNI